MHAHSQSHIRGLTGPKSHTSHTHHFFREIQSRGKKEKNVKIQPQGFVDTYNSILMPSMHPRPLSCLPHHHPMQKHGMSRRGGIRTPPARAATSRHCSLGQPPSCADSKCPIFLGCGASTTSTTVPLDLLLPPPFNSSAYPPLLQR